MIPSLNLPAHIVKWLWHLNDPTIKFRNNLFKHPFHTTDCKKWQSRVRLKLFMYWFVNISLFTNILSLSTDQPTHLYKRVGDGKAKHALLSSLCSFHHFSSSDTVTLKPLWLIIIYWAQILLLFRSVSDVYVNKGRVSITNVIILFPTLRNREKQKHRGSWLNLHF